MIPIRLKLQNFMAYHRAELDFQPFHLAALVGDNGAGKSTLLDAITYAIWGEGRAKEDALVRLGTTDMEVEFEFDLHGNRYRVIRKRSNKGKGRGRLDLHAHDELGWQTLSDTSKRSTQTKINQLVNLDYTTFINSVFLMQGRADEFTTKKPNERKEILSDILGLSRYDLYEERARKRARGTQLEVKSYEGKIVQIDDELKHRDRYNADLAKASQAVNTLTETFENAEATWKRNYEEQQRLRQKLPLLQDYQARLERDEQNRAELTRNVLNGQKRVERYTQIIEQRTAILAGLSELETARQAVTDWEARQQKHQQLLQQQFQLQRQLDQAQAELTSRLQQCTSHDARLKQQADRLAEFQQRHTQLSQQLTELAGVEATRDRDRGQVGTLQQKIAQLEGFNAQIVRDGKQLKKKRTELDEAGALCPVCKTVLTLEHRAHASAQFEQELSNQRAKYRAQKQELTALGEQVNQLEAQIKTATRQLQQQHKLQNELGQLQQSLHDAEQAQQQRQPLAEQIRQLETQLAQRAFAPDLRQQLGGVEQELATVDYDGAVHQQARQTVQTLRHFEVEQRGLEEAELNVADAERRLQADQTRLTELESQLSQDRQQVAELKRALDQLPHLGQEVDRARHEADRLQREKRLAHDRVAHAKANLDYLVGLDEKKAEYTANIAAERHKLGIYRELQAAFGKKGVQALLIENAVPEIEQEANQLLRRMTDGQMHLRFETQRETKTTDNVIETLDIQISDGLGTRDYGMYSGGEAFRINFAVRIAISKVLARRAGAQLQTLFIDEGFGSQDEHGRERLIEVLNSIRQDFQKVIVITHIDELKEKFPVRIEVEKTAEGSHLTVR